MSTSRSAARPNVARPEDLIIYKLFAGRPKDIQDAESLLLLHRREIDPKRVRRVLGQLEELSGDSNVAARLASIVRAAPKVARPKRGK